MHASRLAAGFRTAAAAHVAGPLTTDAFPLRVLPRRNRLPAILSRYLLAWRLRKCACPVLLSDGKTRKPYARLLVPVGRDEAAADAAAVAARIAPRGQLAFLHAYHLPESEMHASVSVEAVVACRVIARDGARRHLDTLVESLDLECDMVSRVVQYGRAEQVAAGYANRMGADLVVLAVPARHRGGWHPWAGLAMRLLACTCADILLVPQGSASGSAGRAATGD